MHGGMKAALAVLTRACSLSASVPSPASFSTAAPHGWRLALACGIMVPHRPRADNIGEDCLNHGFC